MNYLLIITYICCLLINLFYIKNLQSDTLETTFLAKYIEQDTYDKYHTFTIAISLGNSYIKYQSIDLDDSGQNIAIRINPFFYTNFWFNRLQLGYAQESSEDTVFFYDSKSVFLEYDLLRTEIFSLYVFGSIFNNYKFYLYNSTDYLYENYSLKGRELGVGIDLNIYYYLYLYYEYSQDKTFESIYQEKISYKKNLFGVKLKLPLL